MRESEIERILRRWSSNGLVEGFEKEMEELVNLYEKMSKKVAYGFADAMAAPVEGMQAANSILDSAIAYLTVVQNRIYLLDEILFSDGGL